ncbi:hypothetical protein Tco_1039840 [Tanacetum coccineum]
MTGVTVQNMQGRQTQSYTGNFAKGKATGTWVIKSTGNIITNQSRVIRCYNCKCEGNLKKWGVALDEEQLALLANIAERVDSSPDAQALTTTSIFQTDDLDAFDSDCDEAPTASAVFMANLSAYDSDVLFELQNYDTYQDNNVIDQTQQIQPVLYSGSALAEKHDAISVIDTEETLRLAEESRRKMKEKQYDSIVKQKKVNITAIDYASLNKLYVHFVLQKQLSAKQAFWLPISKTVYETPSVQPEPVQKDLPRQLPSTSMVKQNLLKAKSHLDNFDKVIKVRTKVTRKNEESFKKFELDLYREVYDMKAIFQQMETEVEQCSVDRKYFEIEKKLLIENDRLLEQIISQDVFLELEAELLKKKDMVAKEVYNELSKRFSRLEKHCISLEISVQQSKESVQNDRPCHN